MWVIGCLSTSLIRLPSSPLSSAPHVLWMLSAKGFTRSSVHSSLLRLHLKNSQRWGFLTTPPRVSASLLAGCLLVFLTWRTLRVVNRWRLWLLLIIAEFQPSVISFSPRGDGKSAGCRSALTGIVQFSSCARHWLQHFANVLGWRLLMWWIWSSFWLTFIYIKVVNDRIIHLFLCFFMLIFFLIMSSWLAEKIKVDNNIQLESLTDEVSNADILTPVQF